LGIITQRRCWFTVLQPGFAGDKAAVTITLTGHVSFILLRVPCGINDGMLNARRLRVPAMAIELLQPGSIIAALLSLLLLSRMFG